MQKSTKTTDISSSSHDSSLEELERQHQVLLSELAKIGLVLRGSIELRLARCGNPKCRCKAVPPVLHGPYYKWTRKVAGKTVNATLTKEQADRFIEWNRNMHKLDHIIDRLQEIGLVASNLIRGV